MMSYMSVHLSFILRIPPFVSVFSMGCNDNCREVSNFNNSSNNSVTFVPSLAEVSMYLHFHICWEIKSFYRRIINELSIFYLQSFTRLFVHFSLAGVLVALVAHQHHGNPIQIAFHLVDRLQDGLQLLQTLSGDDREDKDERVAFRDRQSLHGWKLVRTRRVGYVQGANGVVWRYDL